MHYFVCGFMACGKSTYLKKVRGDDGYFGYSFFDLDAVIFKKWGKDFNDLGSLIKAKGFEWFRKRELESLELIWKNEENTFTALGGGSLTDEVMELIKCTTDCKGYYLEADFETCYKRIMNSCERPLSTLSKLELESLYSERLIHYKKFETLS